MRAEATVHAPHLQLFHKSHTTERKATLALTTNQIHLLSHPKQKMFQIDSLNHDLQYGTVCYYMTGMGTAFSVMLHNEPG